MSGGLALMFAGYTGLLLRQAWFVFRAQQRGGLIYIPYLLIKLAIMGVAIAYWFPEYCKRLTIVGDPVFIVAVAFSLADAARALKHVSARPARTIVEDDLNVAFTLFTTVLCPLVLLYFVYKISLNQCVAI